MRIEHMAMYVNNLEKTKEFFVKYFDAISNEGYHNKTTDFRSYFLSFDDGARLEIMNRPQMMDDEKGRNTNTQCGKNRATDSGCFVTNVSSGIDGNRAGS